MRFSAAPISGRLAARPPPRRLPAGHAVPRHRRTDRDARRAAPALLALLGLGALTLAGTARGDPPGVALGLGRYYTAPMPGTQPAAEAPAARLRTPDIAGSPAPTNQWYSAVMFEQGEVPLYVQPLTIRATRAGIELGVPTKRVVAAAGTHSEVRYTHEAALEIAPLAFTPRDARLAGYSDWLARIRLGADGGAALTTTVLHGSPFAYFECTHGDVAIRVHGAAGGLAPPAGADPRVLVLDVAGRAYALFAPSGGRWQTTGPGGFVLHLAPRARYFSVAALPDRDPATVADFLKFAYAFPVETRTRWRYDERTSRVTSDYQVLTVAREGNNRRTFLGLYPHHWASATAWAGSSTRPAVRYEYQTVRGRIRLIEGNGFTIEHVFHGIVPRWPGLVPEDHARLAPLLAADGASLAATAALPGEGPYWTGKSLGANAQLLEIATAEQEPALAAEFLKRLELRMQAWFRGSPSGYFLRDDTLGTLAGLPEEYHSLSNMNDHHFHYGYWLMAAAHVALHDPVWADRAHWGGMVAALVADIATGERGRADYPFLRNVDLYESHSWASGTGALTDGNNQESSSEAVNAWAALVLWGEATGDRRLRDLGIFLYTNEIAALEAYWFDLDRTVLASDFGRPFASLVFGGKYVYGTWWTDEPRQILGINLLPFTPASTYLAADPAFAERALAALPGMRARYLAHDRNDGTPPDIWQDLLACYQALIDPERALAAWSRDARVEFGESRAHTLYWMLSLRELGRPDFSVTADTALYAVFRDAHGTRTYLAYNAGTAPRRVSFSSGVTLVVPPGALARTH